MLNWKTDHRHCFTCELEKPLFASRRLALSDKICWCLMWESTRLDKKKEKQQRRRFFHCQRLCILPPKPPSPLKCQFHYFLKLLLLSLSSTLKQHCFKPHILGRHGLGTPTQGIGSEGPKIPLKLTDWGGGSTNLYPVPEGVPPGSTCQVPRGVSPGTLTHGPKFQGYFGPL